MFSKIVFENNYWSGSCSSRKYNVKVILSSLQIKKISLYLYINYLIIYYILWFHVLNMFPYIRPLNGSNRRYRTGEDRIQGGSRDLHVCVPWEEDHQSCRRPCTSTRFWSGRAFLVGWFNQDVGPPHLRPNSSSYNHLEL